MHQVFHQGQIRVALHCADIDVGIAVSLQHVIQSRIDCVGVVIGAVSHEDQKFIVLQIRVLFHDAADQCPVIFCGRQKRGADPQRMETVFIGTENIQHMVVFHPLMIWVG